MLPYAVNTNSVSIFVNGGIKTIDDSASNYKQILEMVRKQPAVSEQDIIDALVPKISFKLETKVGLLEIRRNQETGGFVVSHNNRVLGGSITEKVLKLWRDGHGLKPFANLISRIYMNPDPDIVNRIFDFLEVNQFPITEEGYFIGFKKVQMNYMDIFSGTIRNAVGDTPNLHRSEVDCDSNKTCSHGLHVCSFKYLPKYGSTVDGKYRVMICKIDPYYVCAIPNDYDNAKIRTCRYEIIGECSNIENAGIVQSAVTEKTKEPEVLKSTSGFDAPAGFEKTVVEQGLGPAAQKIGVAVHFVKNWLLENHPSVLADVIEFKTKSGKLINGLQVLEGISTSGSMASFARALGVHPSTVGEWKRQISNLKKSVQRNP